MTVDFDPFSRDFFDDPYDTYELLREEAPCFHSEKWDFYAFSRFDDVVAVHRNTKSFTSTHGLTYDQLISPEFAATMNRSIIMMDPPEHTRYRKLVSRSFTPRAIGAHKPMVSDLIAEYLDPLMDRSEFDIVGEFAGPFPVEVICAILGVPKPDRQMIRHQTDAMLTREEGQPLGSAAQAEAAIDQAVYFVDFVADKRLHPGDDMTTALIESQVETDDGEFVSLSDHEIAGFCSLLAAAGSETVTKLLGSAVVAFDDHPGEWAKLLEDGSKVYGAVEETLRYRAPSQYQGRLSVDETQWHGVTVRAGKPVFLLTGAANHDPREYKDPSRFDIDRPPRLAIGFGHGIHNCLGAALARLESAVALEEIARRWPSFSVDKDGLERVQMSNVAGYSKVPISVS
ncbi:MAG: cytochrome P450 [Acidobacteria bacterium]|nr:cytochrome P450 [Acidobacteriota bacterium]